MLHVDTFTVLDGTLYSKIELGGAAKWHQSMDEQNVHPVKKIQAESHSPFSVCFRRLRSVTHRSSTFHGTSNHENSYHTAIASAAIGPAPQINFRTQFWKDKAVQLCYNSATTVLQVSRFFFLLLSFPPLST